MFRLVSDWVLAAVVYSAGRKVAEMYFANGRVQVRLAGTVSAVKLEGTIAM